MKGFGAGGDLPGTGVELVDIVHALKDAMASHDAWLWAINRSLVCNLPLHTHNENSCEFNLWRENAEAVLHRRKDEFEKIILSHEQVHRSADRLMKEAGQKRPLSVSVYDSFLKEWGTFKEEAQRLERELWYDSCLADPLTGLRNRHGMMLELKTEKQRAIREHQSCVIAMLDVDHFKSINDGYGHVQGDAVLRQLSQQVATRLRAYDRIYRYGGEEFLICLPDTDLNQAGTIVERLRADIERSEFRVGNQNIPVTVSIGLSSLTEHSTLEESLEHADRALYVAKVAGRNRVVLGGPEGLGCFGPEPEPVN